MKNKFKNLPVGTKVEVGTECLLLNNNHRIMTVIGYDSEKREDFNKVYRVKEFQDDESYNYILPEEIQRIISYPIDKSKLVVGAKVLIRSDLEVCRAYGGFDWHGEKTLFAGEVVTIKKCDYGKSHNPTFKIEEVNARNNGIHFTAEMVEKIIEEPVVIAPLPTIMVDGIEAWNQMKQGKYASHGGWLGKIVDGKLHKTHKVNEKPWKFVRSNVHLNWFMGGEYQILDELPEWAQEPINPFKMGDIVTLEIEGSTGATREVTEVIDGEKFMAKETYGNVSDWKVRTHRLATQEEELNYWKKRAKYSEETK